VTGRPTAVHQFHAGTAEGDAITQQMLSVQHRLRRLGHRSEIFAIHIPPSLNGRIRPLSSYRGSADQVLIIYHSIGNEALDQLRALPDRKIVNYENITPEEFFTSDAVRRAVRLGRSQLKELATIADAATANSNYTRRELLAAGARRADVLPVQTQFGRYAAAPGTTSRSRDWLSVGRLVGNKCQHDIIAAFGVYATAFDAASHLHLVGDTSDHAYVSELRELAGAMHVRERVLFWGKVSEEDLVARYSSAGVYVSMSEHEGFGVPLLEAMAAGLPVLAYSAAAVPETLGGAGIELYTKDPWFVAGVAHTILADDTLRHRVRDRQDTRLTKLAAFDMDATLTRAIERAGGADQPLQVQIQGPFETSYSLAVLNRHLALALDEIDGVEVSLYATEGPGDYVPDTADLRRHPAAARLHERSVSTPYPDVVIRQLYPPRLADSPGGIRCLYFGWEESRVPDEYVRSFNEHLEGIGVMSTYVAVLLRASGVTIPISVMGVGVEAPVSGGPLPREARQRKGFVFLHVSSAFPRKGIDLLLQAYFASFTATDDVTLILKTFPNPHNDVATLLAEARRGHESPPDVIWIDQDLPREAIDALYGVADCYVHPARGEGFGLPVAEAMLAEVPVITVAHSGLLEFSSDDTALIVRHRIEPANTHLTVAGSMWAEPDVEHLAERLREIHRAPEAPEVRRRASTAKALIEANFSWSAVAARWRRFVEELQASARTVSTVMVSPWNSRCGIAEYTRQLVEACGIRADIEVFADQDVQILDLNAERRTTRLWRDRSNPDLSALTAAVLASSSELVHIQFNFGFFELRALAHLIETVAPRKAVVLTFHATEDVEIGDELVSLGQIVPALAKADALIAHQQADVERLRAFGLTENVHLLPQGAPSEPPVSTEEARAGLGLSDRSTVATFGFLLPHKGVLELIEAVDLLRSEIPDILLLAPCAIHPDPSSGAYREVCEQLIRARRLEGHVTLITDFLADDAVRTLLAAADVIALPYAETAESSSAAMRFVLGIGAPIIATDIEIFEDVKDVVLQTKTNDPAELAEAIRHVLRSRDVAETLGAAARERAAAVGWPRVAAAHLETYRSIIAGRRET